MNDLEIVAMLERQLRAAEDVGPSADDFAKAIEYYYCRPRGDEMTGRSNIQSSDVCDMIQAVKAQILPSFSGDAICQFEPDGPDDEAMARLESDATNAVLMERSRGFTVISEAVQDALLLKNCIIKGYLEEADGRRYIRLKAVDPTAFRVGADVDCVLLYNARFLAERKVYSRSELVEMGFDSELVAEIPAEGEDADATMPLRRRTGVAPTAATAGWANERVVIWECYSQLPEEEDATKTKLFRCLLGGTVLLEKEPVAAHPYAAGTGFIEPHSFWGLSIYDRLRSVQDEKTAIRRGWLDNLSNCNNSRTAANENVNIDDLKNGRPGGIIRIKGMGPIGESLLPIPAVDVGPAALSYLQYCDQTRSDRAGAALQMQSGELQSVNQAPGFQAVDRIYSVQEAMSGMIARTLAETALRSAFVLTHRLLREELGEELTLRLADQWVTVDPSQWRPRDRVNIKSGLSPGEKSRKVSALQTVISLQGSALQMGLDGTNVNIKNIHAAQLDLCSALDLDAGERYFMNPESQEALANMQQKGQQAAQMQSLQMQLTQAQVQIEQGKLALEQQAQALDKYKADLQAQIDVWKERLHAEIEEAKLIGGATLELNRVEAEGRNALALASVQPAGMGAGTNGAGSAGI